MKCNKITIDKFVNKLPYIPAVSILIHTFSTRFYYKISFEILSNFTLPQSSEYSYWSFSNNLNVFLTLTFSKLAKISMKKHMWVTDWQRPYWMSQLKVLWYMNFWPLVDYLFTACIWLYTSGFSGKKNVTLMMKRSQKIKSNMIHLALQG